MNDGASGLTPCSVGGERQREGHVVKRQYYLRLPSGTGTAQRERQARPYRSAEAAGGAVSKIDAENSVFLSE
jgi:hypothetical protein